MPGNLSTLRSYTTSGTSSPFRKSGGACLLALNQLDGGAGPAGPLGPPLMPLIGGRIPTFGRGMGMSATWSMSFREGWTVGAVARAVSARRSSSVM